MPGKRSSCPAKTASTRPASSATTLTAGADSARSKWNPRNIKKEHIMMAAPLFVAGKELFKGPIESAKKGANDILQHRVDDTVSGIDNRLSGRHGRHHRRHSDSGSESSASGSTASKPAKQGKKSCPGQLQHKVDAASVINIQLNLNVYPATLAGFVVQLDVSCPSQPSWPLRKVYITHENIFVSNPQLFTYITFSMLREFEYLSRCDVPSNTYDPPFELPLAPEDLVYLEDPYPPGLFRDANEAMQPYGISVPYNPLSRFQLVVLPGGQGSRNIFYEGELARTYFQQHQDVVIRFTRDQLRRDPSFNVPYLEPVTDVRQKTLAQYFREWDNCIQRSVLMNSWIPKYTPLQQTAFGMSSQPRPYAEDNRRRSSSVSAQRRYSHGRRRSSDATSSKSAASEKKKESHNYMPMLLPMIGAFGGNKAASPASVLGQGHSAVPPQGPVTRKPLLTGYVGEGGHASNGAHPVVREESRYTASRSIGQSARTTNGRVRTARRRRQYV